MGASGLEPRLPVEGENGQAQRPFTSTFARHPEKLGAESSQEQAEGGSGSGKKNRRRQQDDQQRELEPLLKMRNAKHEREAQQQQDTRVCVGPTKQHQQLEHSPKPNQRRANFLSMNQRHNTKLAADKPNGTRNSDKQTLSCRRKSSTLQRRRSSSMTNLIIGGDNSISQLLSRKSCYHHHLVTLLSRTTQWWSLSRLLFILLLAHVSPLSSFTGGAISGEIGDSRWRPLVAPVAATQTVATNTETNTHERPNFEVLSSQHSPLSATLHFTRTPRPLAPGVHWRATRAAANGRPNAKFVYDLSPSLNESHKQRGNDRRLSVPSTTITPRPPVNVSATTEKLPDLTTRSMLSESTQFDDDLEPQTETMFKVNEPTMTTTSTSNVLLSSPTMRDEFVVGKEFLAPKLRDALSRYQAHSYTTLDSTLGLDQITTLEPPVRFVLHNRTSGPRDDEGDRRVVSNGQLMRVSFNADQPFETTNTTRRPLIHRIRSNGSDSNFINFQAPENRRRSVGLAVNPILLANDVKVRSDLLVIAGNNGRSPVGGLPVKSLSGSYNPEEPNSSQSWFAMPHRSKLFEDQFEGDDQMRWRQVGNSSDYIEADDRDVDLDGRRSTSVLLRLNLPQQHGNRQQVAGSQWSNELDDGNYAAAAADYDGNSIGEPDLPLEASSSLMVAHEANRQHGALNKWKQSALAAVNERNGNNDINKRNLTKLLAASEPVEAASSRWTEVATERPAESKFALKKKVGLLRSAAAASPGIRVTIGEGTRPLMLNSRGLITAVKRVPPRPSSSRPYNPSSLASQTSYSLSPIETNTLTSGKRPVQADTWDDLSPPPMRRRPNSTNHLHSFPETGSSSSTSFTDLMDSGEDSRGPYATESVSSSGTRRQQASTSTTPMSATTEGDDTDESGNKTSNSHLFTHNPPYKQHLLPAITIAPSGYNSTTSKAPQKLGNRPTNATHQVKRPAGNEPPRQQSIVHKHELHGSENHHKVSHAPPPYGLEGASASVGGYSTPMNQLNSSSISQNTITYGAQKPTKFRTKIQNLLIGKIIKNGYPTVPKNQQQQQQQGQGSTQGQQTASSPMPLLSSTVANNVANLLAAKLSSLVTKPAPLFGSNYNHHHSSNSLLGSIRPNKFKNRNPFVTPNGANIHRRTTGVGSLLVSGFIYGLSMLPALMALTGVNPLTAISDSGSSLASLAANRQSGHSPDKRAKPKLSSHRPASLLALPSHDSPDGSAASSHFGYLIPLLTAAAAGSSLEPDASDHHLQAHDGHHSALKSLYAPPPTILSQPPNSATATGDLGEGTGSGSDLSNLISIDEPPPPSSSQSNEEDEQDGGNYLAFGSGKLPTRRPSGERNDQPLALSSSQPWPDRAEMPPPPHRVRRHRAPQDMAQPVSHREISPSQSLGFSPLSASGSQALHSHLPIRQQQEQPQIQVHPLRQSANRVPLAELAHLLPAPLFAPIGPLRLTGAPTLALMASTSADNIRKQQVVSSQATTTTTNPLIGLRHPEHSRRPTTSTTNWRSAAHFGQNFPIGHHGQLASGRPDADSVVLLGPYNPSLAGGSDGAAAADRRHRHPQPPIYAPDHTEEQSAQRRRRTISNQSQNDGRWSLNLGATRPSGGQRSAATTDLADGPKLQVGYTLNYAQQSADDGAGLPDATDWRAIRPPSEEIVRGKWKKPLVASEQFEDELPAASTTTSTTTKPRGNKWSARQKGHQASGAAAAKQKRGQKSGKSAPKTIKNRKSIATSGGTLSSLSLSSSGFNKTTTTTSSTTTDRPPSPALDEGESELQLAHSMAMGSRILNEPLVRSHSPIRNSASTRRPAR